MESNRQARVILWSIMKRDDTRQVFEKLGSRKKPSKKISKKKKIEIQQGNFFDDIT
jgi:hypothetical protein